MFFFLFCCFGCFGCFSRFFVLLNFRWRGGAVRVLYILIFFYNNRMMFDFSFLVCCGCLGACGVWFVLG